MHTHARNLGRTFAAFIGAGFVLLALLAFPGSVRADDPPAPPASSLELPKVGDLPALPTLFQDLEGSFGTIWDMVITAAGIVFMVLLLIGGLQYLTSAGNEESTKKARALLLDAVIGLALVLLAWPIGKYAIDKLELDESIQIGATGDPTTLPAIGASGKATVVVTVTGTQTGQLQLRSSTIALGPSSPAKQFALIETANAAGYSQTSTISNGEATFTGAPTREKLEYVYNGTIIKPTTLFCPTTLSSAATNGEKQTVTLMLLDAAIPPAYAATSITGEDDNFSVPGTNTTFEQSTQNQGSSSSSGTSGSGSGSETLSIPGSSKNNSGTSSNSNRFESSGDGTGKLNIPVVVDCPQPIPQTVNVDEKATEKVTIRVALLDVQSPKKPIANVQVTAVNTAAASTDSAITDSEGHAKLHLNPGTEYNVSIAGTSAIVSRYQEVLHTTPSQPLGTDEPIAVWTLFARQQFGSKLVIQNFHVVDSSGNALTHKKLYVMEYQTDNDGHDYLSGNFNDGNPVDPTIGGVFSLKLPVGRRITLRYFDTKYESWVEFCDYTVPDSGDMTSGKYIECKADTTVDFIHPAPFPSTFQ